MTVITSAGGAPVILSFQSQLHCALEAERRLYSTQIKHRLYTGSSSFPDTPGSGQKQITWVGSDHGLPFFLVAFVSPTASFPGLNTHGSDRVLF